MPDETSIPFRCPHCGSEAMLIPASKADSDVVTCQDCGKEVGTYKQVKDKMKADALTYMRKRMKDTFKGFGKRR